MVVLFVLCLVFYYIIRVMQVSAFTSASEVVITDGNEQSIRSKNMITHRT